jgi:hypothetical protein
MFESNKPSSGGSHATLKPLNVLMLFVLLSPIILITFVTSMSVVFQNWKGLIYLFCVFNLCFFRHLVYAFTTSDSPVEDTSVCSSIGYMKYGNSTISMFLFAFTIVYIVFPTIVNAITIKGSVNWFLTSGLIFYAVLDLYVRSSNCNLDFSETMLNISSGSILAMLITGTMYYFGAKNYLFFNELVSNKESCSVSKNQTFKCSVFKNGELIGGI